MARCFFTITATSSIPIFDLTRYSATPSARQRSSSLVCAKLVRMITGTDFIVTLPRRVHKLLAPASVFGHCEAPHGLPGFTLDMQWNETSEQDSANTWFREQVVKVCAEQGLL